MSGTGGLCGSWRRTMAGEISILDAVAKLAEMTIAVKEAERAAMEKATRIVQAEAKREIGHYQD